ncbi:DUF2304 domain-containing protein [Neorhodopirellula pilleata]|uniref:DUF2304 domain-containing protein n=1 Tax=Neorhodopirellula pilleata TaxID=2714738 RepID=A0A5C6A277_9BACT|nr:DUF2304 domain-containing protein [Neorhodopirellula pilleata]TWT93516.1 hypothetical protein Pla100_40340 [Neorhodopirellula pilleata]
MNAERLMMVAGVIAFLLTLYWVRSRELKERYALGWLGLATALLLFGLFPDVIKNFAKAWHLSYASAVLFFALAVIYVYSFFVSVSLSRQHRKTVRLIQEIGILKEQVRALQARQDVSELSQDAATSPELNDETIRQAPK